MPNSLQPLRVAIIASSLKLAGAEKQTVYMARALFEAQTDTRFFLVGESGHYEAVLRRMGIPFRQIYKPNRPLFILARLARALASFRPHIVFAPQFGDLIQAGIAGRLCQALVLGGLRSDGFYEFKAHGRRSRWMLRLPHGLVANSRRAVQNLALCVTNRPRIQILPNALDLHEFDARSQMPSHLAGCSNRVLAVAVGSLQPSKRFDRFLNALAMARTKAPALLGVIAGTDCGAKIALERKAHELGLLPDHVVFLGECDNIPALLASAGLLVLSSEYEGFPNVILEAMAARLPVIATRVGDVEQIVLEEQTGYVVDGADVGVMADRMTRLALSPETRTQLGTAGRSRVLQEYNYDSLPTRLLSVFHTFAAQEGRRELMEILQGRAYAKAPASVCEAMSESLPAT